MPRISQGSTSHFKPKKRFVEVLQNNVGARRAVPAFHAMKSDFEKPSRRSIRLKNFDYRRAGAYFLTVCLRKRLCLLGDIVEGQMNASPAGQMVAKAWGELPEHYAGVNVDSFVLMPNHIHGIIVLNTSSVGAAPCGRPSSPTAPNPGQPRGVAPTNEKRLTLPDVVHRFKSWTTKLYSDGIRQHRWRPFPGQLWQRNYYEHIIRNDDDLEKIREYISTNPSTWDTDMENPARARHAVPLQPGIP